MYFNAWADEKNNALKKSTERKRVDIKTQLRLEKSVEKISS